jgi:hypothetical protein
MFRHWQNLQHEQPMPALLIAGLILSTLVCSYTMFPSSKRRPSQYQPFLQPTGSGTAAEGGTRAGAVAEPGQASPVADDRAS